MNRLLFNFSPWLDVLAIAAWGGLFLYYRANGKLFLLIHPSYMWLTVVAGVVLVVVALLKGMVLMRQARRSTVRGGSGAPHLRIFPPGIGSLLLLAIAILGMVITPRAFASQTALDRGATDTLTVTRVRPQVFRGSEKTEDKSLVDWIRTLTVYPEPDAYTGQKAKVQGFVIYPPNLPNQYLLIARFVITCCAADVYPVSLPVKLAQSRDTYKADSWLEIEGAMMTETLAEKRQLVIEAKTIKEIPEPKNPYEY
ncbi:TIGR03943 family protein [Leptothermofonsia sichuanensis E412]|uniref:TIGR03943 family putative permease subunit n=1 Tax=Leptothermofonsia sichuanensis TaxID=2917832 RepID=UPI001CA615E9|nr:TIGR03943 family protein [Leptothermofonsia sichuanensis]QZZ20940.1 TIGR03943 family protein [Leptothermofonsia sichuanensis E412]